MARRPHASHNFMHQAAASASTRLVGPRSLFTSKAHRNATRKAVQRLIQRTVPRPRLEAM